jgi:hypothetical protein
VCVQVGEEEVQGSILVSHHFRLHQVEHLGQFINGCLGQIFHLYMHTYFFCKYVGICQKY